MKLNVKIKNNTFFLFFVLLSILIGCKTNQTKNKNTYQKETVLADNMQQQKHKISDYENNEDYFIREIDINKDGILDKVVCSNKYMGNELLFFQKKNNHYNFVLETINFSEDGGRIIDDIQPVKNSDYILKIKTFFPDGGLDLATYFITFKNGNWKLQKTIYETKYWQKDASKRYVCEVKQDILLSELMHESGIEKIKQIPKEEDRERDCKIVIE